MKQSKAIKTRQRVMNVISEKNKPQSILVIIRAIRKHCQDCCGGVVSEIEKCQIKKCALWRIKG